MRKIFSMIMTCAMVLSVFIGVFSISSMPVEGAVVNPGESIQAAIDAAVPGEVITVNPGTYNLGFGEELDITKPLILRSSGGAGVTFITPAFSEYIIDINADNVTIDGFTINGNAYNAGIIIWGIHRDLTVVNNVIDCTINGGSSQDGFRAFQGQNNHTIVNNEIFGGYNGIVANDVRDSQISGNTITDVTDHGIHLVQSPFNTISNNVIDQVAGGTDADGIHLDFNSPTNEVENNTISNCVGNGIYMDSRYHTIQDNDIDLCDTGIRGGDNSGNHLIVRNNVTNGNEGMHLRGNGSKIYHNNFVNNVNHATTSFRHNDWNQTGGPHGNHWDNYTLPDGDSNKIVDNPFPIPGNIPPYLDYFPLTIPYPLPPPPPDYNMTVTGPESYSDQALIIGDDLFIENGGSLTLDNVTLTCDNIIIRNGGIIKMLGCTVMTGSITIEDGGILSTDPTIIYAEDNVWVDGTLLLDDTDMRMNSSYHRELRIQVNATGNLTIQNNSVLHSNNSFGYKLITLPGAIYTIDGTSAVEDEAWNLAGEWLMEEVSEQWVNDTSGYGNNGTLMPSYPGNVPSWVDGISGKALEFDGVDDYVDCGNDDGLNLTNSFTWSAWIKTSDEDWNPIFAKDNNADNGTATGYRFYKTVDEKIRAAGSWGGSWSTIDSTGTISLGEWNHVVASFNGTHVNLFINGFNSGSATASPLTNSDDNLLIGKDYQAGPALFNGMIDEVSIWSRALNATEIDALYHFQQPFTINYSIGWNLVSFPVLNPLIGNTPINKISDIENVTDFQMAVKWDAGTQSYEWYIPGFSLPTDPENFIIGPDDAFFIWMDSDDCFVGTGNYPGPRNVALQSGWNMIGYKSHLIGDVEADWAGQVTCGAFDDIAYYDGTMFVHYIFTGTVMALEPGRGYFIWSDADTVLIYQ